jgi:multiple sugar transport system substrate-binding protein
VHLNGTWVIGDYNASSETAGTALNKGGYAVYPYPQLFGGKKAQYADGHSWAVSTKDRSDEENAAIGKFLKFFHDNDFDWSRTGHLPAVKAVLDSKEFKALPHRDTIASIATLGTALPSTVQRQFAIQDIIGQEMSSAMYRPEGRGCGARGYGVPHQRVACQYLRLTLSPEPKSRCPPLVSRRALS